MPFQPPLPREYASLSHEALHERVAAVRAALGPRLVILGHHYQQDDVIRHADFTGDSLRLSRLAAAQSQAEYVVFCGVHFMAESADILTRDEVAVILPDLSAGCSMADMAAIEQLEDAWDRLRAATDATIVPITYVNSSAAVKAFCGRHGGACCTSSNARRVLEYALTLGEKVLFVPDQHLGRNTACGMGYDPATMALYDPAAPGGGLDDDAIRRAKFILWKGHCSVHQLFTEAHCDAVRAADPECRILVHPECRREVVLKADLTGSTEAIIRILQEAPDGSRWAVGTEANLVNRLSRLYAGRKHIRSLAGLQCLCTTMYRIDLPHLAWALDELAAGRVVNRISVDPRTRHDARIALQRMLDHADGPAVAAG